MGSPTAPSVERGPNNDELFRQHSFAFDGMMQNTGSRIGVSGMFVKTSIVGGAEFMLYNLVEGLIASRKTVALFVADGAHLDPMFRDRTTESRRTELLTIVPVSGRGNRFVRETMALPRAARSAGVTQLIFPNYFTPPTVKSLRVVTAILDLQYLHYPGTFSNTKRAWLRLAHAGTMRWANRVIAISDFVRNDILERYGAKHADRVQTIHTPVSWDRFRSPTRPACLADRSRPYVLSVASQYEHKNISTLIRAFAQIHHRIDHDLVLVGQRKSRLAGVVRGVGLDLDMLVDELHIRDRVVITGHLDDRQLGYCYQHASAFVLPSLFEGFGMPAVEALGFGLPVITTRCGSLPEVTQGLARYVEDPRSVGELAEAVIEVIASPDTWTLGNHARHEYRMQFDPATIAGRYAAALDP